MTRKTKRILGGVVGTISVLAVVLLLANKLLNQPQRIAYLPANYDRQDTAHEIPPTSPITTEKQDKQYEFGGYTYGLRLTTDKPYFPYMLGGKVTGTIELLKDGRPAKMLPATARNNYAPHRPDDPLVAEISIEGLMVPNRPFYNDSSNSPQSYREPAVNLAYIYSPQTIAVTADTTTGREFTTTVIDLSTGHATFELVNGGANSPNSVVDIRIAGSIGPLPEGDWEKAMMFTSANLVMEDKVRNFVELPIQTAVTKSTIYYNLQFDPPFVIAQQNRKVKITVKAYDSETNQPYVGIDHKVLLISHPLRKYRGYIGYAGVYEVGSLTATGGEFKDGKLSNQISGATPTIEVELKQGVGEAIFLYNGKQWLAPELNFSVLSADAAKALNSRVGWTTTRDGQIPIETTDQAKPQSIDRGKFDEVTGGATDKYISYDYQQLWQAFFDAPAGSSDEQTIIRKMQNFTNAQIDYGLNQLLDDFFSTPINSDDEKKIIKKFQRLNCSDIFDMNINFTNPTNDPDRAEKWDKYQKEVTQYSCTPTTSAEPAGTAVSTTTKIAPFPYTTAALPISNGTSAQSINPHTNIWLAFLIYQIAKMALGGLTLFIIHRWGRIRYRAQGTDGFSAKIQ